MASSKYRIATVNQLLHDYSPLEEVSEVAALVASGDCFITLATRLDDMLHAEGSVDAAVIEDIIRTLLYLQRHYAVTKMPSNYRQ